MPELEELTRLPRSSPDVYRSDRNQAAAEKRLPCLLTAVLKKPIGKSDAPLSAWIAGSFDAKTALRAFCPAMTKQKLFRRNFA